MSCLPLVHVRCYPSSGEVTFSVHVDYRDTMTFFLCCVAISAFDMDWWGTLWPVASSVAHDTMVSFFPIISGSSIYMKATPGIPGLRAGIGNGILGSFRDLHTVSMC